MDTLYDTDLESRQADCRADMEKAGLSYSRVAELITTRYQYVATSSVHNALNQNGNNGLLDYIEAVITSYEVYSDRDAPQWRRLLNWYLAGNEMTARDFVTKIGPTQIHGRHIEIRKHIGYELWDSTVKPYPEKVILWEWHNAETKDYKIYWIPRGEI